MPKMGSFFRGRAMTMHAEARLPRGSRLMKARPVLRLPMPTQDGNKFVGIDHDDGVDVFHSLVNPAVDNVGGGLHDRGDEAGVLLGKKSFGISTNMTAVGANVASKHTSVACWRLWR